MYGVSLFIGGMLLYVIGLVVRAFTLRWLWVWFLVPVFPTTAVVLDYNYAFFIGFMIVIGFLTKADVSQLKKKDDFSATAATVSYIFVEPLLILLIGYLVHMFM